MKTSLLCVTALAAATLSAWAQGISPWVPDGPPTVLSHQFITTGGITYFRLVGLLPGGLCCRRIAGYDVLRQGSALNQIIEQETWRGACIAVVCGPWREELVSVLGALPPGGYNLTLWESGGLGPPSFSSPWGIFPFTVPTNSSPMLTLSTTAHTNGPLLHIHVGGVSNVVYVLESSVNLTDWTALKTNLGAPVTFSASMTNGPNRFYRAAIRPAPTSRRL